MKLAVHTEGESNRSQARQRWQEQKNSPAMQQLLNRDADIFLHQSLSSPCLTAIVRAQGICQWTALHGFSWQ